MNKQPLLLTTAEAGALLGISAIRVRQLIAAGRLAAQKVGRDFLIEPGDLDAVRYRPTGRPPKNGREPRKTRKKLGKKKRGGP